jgi:hypothetical protein
MFLREAGAYLAAAIPNLGLIQLGTLPASPNKVLALRKYSPKPSDLGYGVDGIQFEYPGLQILARGEPLDYAEPEARIEAAYQAGAKVQAKVLSGVQHLIWLPQQPPFLLERDENNCFVFAANFICQKRPSPVPALVAP